MNSQLWSDINNLLALLKGAEAVKLVDNYFNKFGNSAPGSLLRYNINVLQKHLDSHKFEAVKDNLSAVESQVKSKND